MITVAGTGFEPVSLGYEPIKEPLLQPAVENVRLELLLCSPEAACKPLHLVLVIRDEAIFMFIKQSTFLQMLHSRSGPCGNRTRLLSCLQGNSDDVFPKGKLDSFALRAKHIHHHAVPKPIKYIIFFISVP